MTKTTLLCLTLQLSALSACGDSAGSAPGAVRPPGQPGSPTPAPPADASLNAPDTGPTSSGSTPAAPSGGATQPLAEDPLLEDTGTPEEGAGNPATCASETRQSALLPVVLAFAFDVSGSMGKGDEPYHNRQLKWDPVVAATRAFMSDTSSTGVFASLTFFPDDDDRCEMARYTEPDVDFTELPSSVFSDAIDDVTPEDEDDWRGGTPTMAVLQGTIAQIDRRMAAEPDAAYAVVLVTDGMPQDCEEDEDDIENVAAVAGDVADRIPTYVIGVANPVTDEEPDPPDSVSNLQMIAEQGGTETAFLIDTGDPEATSSALRDVIDTIRGNSLTCNITIPEPPPGQAFDTNLINVTATSGGQAVPLGYSSDCSAADGWRFDDETSPSVIELCPDVCTRIQEDAAATLDVEFGCVRRIGVSR